MEDKSIYIKVNVCVCVCVFPIGRKVKKFTKKLKVYSYVKFSEEDNGSSSEPLSAPLRELWGAEPPFENSNIFNLDEI